MDRAHRERLFDQAKRSQSGAAEQEKRAAALSLHKQLPARYWGISLEQVQVFAGLCKEMIRDGKITNVVPEGVPPYPRESWDTVGPNMYQVTDQCIKFLTMEGPEQIGGAPPPVAYASVSLNFNPESGLDCEAFFSHAWMEGLFEFAKNAARAWPSNCKGAYVCFLANPQLLDIGDMCAVPKQSPFYTVLESPAVKKMVMLTNAAVPIHSRLWCCFEMNVAGERDNFPIEVEGCPFFLLEGEGGATVTERMATFSLFEQALAGDRRAFSALDEKYQLAGQEEETQMCLRSIKDAMKAAGGQHKFDFGAWARETLPAEVQQTLLRCRADAQCFSEKDKAMIWEEIGKNESLIDMSIFWLIMEALGRFVAKCRAAGACK